MTDGSGAARVNGSGMVVVPVSVRRAVGGTLMLDMWDLAMKAAADETGKFSPGNMIPAAALAEEGMVSAPDDTPENRAMVAIGLALNDPKLANAVVHRMLELMELRIQDRIPASMLIQPPDDGEVLIHPALIAAVGDETLTHGGKIPMESAMKTAHKNLNLLGLEGIQPSNDSSNRTLQ